MSGDFEKNISQRMDGFQLTPGPQIWERVAAALPEKRRRRFAIWWLVPLAACLVVGGIWLLPGKQKEADDKQMAAIAHKASAEYSILKKIAEVAPVDTAGNYTIQPEVDPSKNLISKKQNSIQQEVDVPKKEVIVKTQSGKTKQHKAPLEAGNVTVQPKAEMPIYEKSLLKRHSQTPANGVADIEYILNGAVGHTVIDKAINSSSKFLSKEPILPLVDLTSIPLPEVVGKLETALPKDRDTLWRTSVGSKTPEMKMKTKKTQWSLMLAVGGSSLTTGSNDQQKSLPSNYQNNSGGLTGSIGTFSNPTSGFNFSAGIRRSQTISKHFNWEAGINYQLLTTKQRTGSRNDSLMQFDALTNRAFYTANNVTSGQGTNRLNKVHRLQIVSGVGYVLNPAANSPIRFSAAASIAYNMGNNLLLHDYRSFSYIQSAKLSNKCMLGGEAGMDVFINHTIYAGLFYQQDFTNVARPKVGSVFRWNQLQLRIGIPLSKY